MHLRDYEAKHLTTLIDAHPLTNDSFDIRSLESGQPQVSDLYQSSGAIDEDVVTLKIPVNDGWCSGMQKLEALQDLSPPATDHLGLHSLQTSHKPNANKCRSCNDALY